MSYSVTYIAKEEIASGHTVDTEYTLTFEADVYNPSTQFIQNTPTSLDGSRETVHIRDDEFYEVNAVFIVKADLQYFKEFIYSTKLSQSFTFTDDGTDYSVVADKPTYRPQRLETTDSHFSIKMRFKGI